MAARKPLPLSKWGRKRLIREVRGLRAALDRAHQAAEVVAIMQGLRDAKRAGIEPRRPPKPYNWDEGERFCVGENARALGFC